MICYVSLYNIIVHCAISFLLRTRLFVSDAARKQTHHSWKFRLHSSWRHNASWPPAAPMTFPREFTFSFIPFCLRRRRKGESDPSQGRGEMLASSRRSRFVYFEAGSVLETCQISSKSVVSSIPTTFVSLCLSFKNLYYIRNS